MQDQFLQNVFTKLELHYADDQFGVEKLSELMHMSRKHLHYKIKTLTNQTPSELIRNFRLRKAAYLLSENAAAVTQICYEVGLSNLSYFSKCFHDFFGQYPSEFSKSKEIK
jgi:AraC-like DNA-binding protein